MAVVTQLAGRSGGQKRMLLSAGLALLVGAGQPALAQSGADYTTYYRWNTAQLLEWKIGADPDGPGGLQRRPAEHYFYDADAQLTRTEVGLVSNGTGAEFTLMHTVHVRYDVLGNKTMVYTVPATSAASDPEKTGAAELIKASTLVQSSYDAEGRVVCVATRMDPQNFASIYASATPPDACTTTVAGSFGPDRIVKTVYDKAGNVEQTIEAFDARDAAGVSQSRTYATYEYTANGQKKSATDAIGNRTELSYDKFDRLYRLTYPVTARGAGATNPLDYEEYGYDLNGNRTTLRKRDGSKLSTCYDALNREYIRFKREVSGCPSNGQADDVFISYDLTGAVTKVSYGSTAAPAADAIAYERDNAGRLTKETTYGKPLSYLHDQAGNLTSMEWPGGLKVSYEYDAADRVKTIYEPGGRTLVTPSYDAANRVSGQSRGNGANTVSLYDAAGRLTRLQHSLNDGRGVLLNTPEHNPQGQVTSRGISNADYAWIATNLSLSASADGLNRDSAIASLTTTCGVAGAGYDCNGNLTNDGFRRYGYDAENRLTSADGLQLAYDPAGRLARTTDVGGAVTRFLYSGDQLVAEMDAGGNLLRRYVHGPGVDDPLVWYEGSTTNDPRWLHADAQGSIVAWSNLAGARGAVYTYGPYGEPGDRWGSGSRFRYTGQIALPEARLYHYKARAYEPVRGWFLQTDPIGGEDDLNLYAYVGGDPLNSSDPTGTFCWGKCPSNADRIAFGLNIGPGQNYLAININSETRQTWGIIGSTATFFVPVAGQEAAAAKAAQSLKAATTGTDFVLAGSSILRKINIRPTTKGWGLTPKHLQKHFFGEGKYALNKIDTSGNPDMWTKNLIELFSAPVTSKTTDGMLDIVKTFPKADGSGVYKMGVRISPAKPDGTHDLVTVLTRQ